MSDRAVPGRFKSEVVIDHACEDNGFADFDPHSSPPDLSSAAIVGIEILGVSLRVFDAAKLFECVEDRPCGVVVNALLVIDGNKVRVRDIDPEIVSASTDAAMLSKIEEFLAQRFPLARTD